MDILKELKMVLWKVDELPKLEKKKVKMNKMADLKVHRNHRFFDSNA